VLAAAGTGSTSGRIRVALPAAARDHELEIWARTDPFAQRLRIALAVPRDSILAGAAVFAIIMIATGVVVLLGAASVPAILCTIVVAAVVVRYRRHQAPEPPPLVERGAPGEMVEEPEPETLCLEDLSRAWRRSHRNLLATPTGPGACKIVVLRQRLLEEFEHRDQKGFARWLAAGARTGSDPGRYLTESRSINPESTE
jgi:hypothetical protein